MIKRTERKKKEKEKPQRTIKIGGVAKVFQSKDRTAIIWCMLFIASCVACAGFSYKLSKSVSEKPQFFILDGSGTYYISPAVDFDDAEDFHKNACVLATEAFFNRNPSGFDNEDKFRKMFYPKFAEKLIEEEIRPTKDYFTNSDIHQKVEIGEIDILRTGGTDVVGKVTGQIIQNGNLDGEAFVIVYKFTAKFGMIFNKNMRLNGRFPLICVNMKHKLEKISE